MPRGGVNSSRLSSTAVNYHQQQRTLINSSRLSLTAADSYEQQRALINSSKLSSTAASLHQQQQTLMSDASNDLRRVRSHFRRLVDEWYDSPENVSPVFCSKTNKFKLWNLVPFRNTPGGDEARDRLKDFVWAGLTDEERDSYGGAYRAGETPNNKFFNTKINEHARSSRRIVVQPTIASAPKGALNAQTGSRRNATNRKSVEKNKEKHKERNQRYMQTKVGKTNATRALKTFRHKERETHFAKRASQQYPVFSSGQSVSEIALDLISKPRLKLYGMSTKQYQEHVGPGQYFLTSQVTDFERTEEAFALWTQTSRPYPAIMKNPGGYPVQERLVDPDEVEILSLERFTKPELLAMGWKWLPLMELDLDGSPTLRPAYALEQQCQILTHDLRLGSQRNNRVPGAGNWDRNATKENRFVVVGFAYAPPGWLNKYYDLIAFVNGKIEFTQPEVASMSLKGANETLSGVGAIY
jgi:hypothetical protein